MDNTPSEGTMASLGTPIAIVIGFALVAAALYFGGSGTGTGNPTLNNNTPPTGPEELVPVSAADHIFGDQNAPITIIEYSDLECPFCKQFHETMKQVVASYPGQVRWVYRNFPLEQLHPNAPKLAEAAECVAELGGNTAYWAFLDEIFKRAPINTFFDFDEMDAAVSAVGVNVTSFNTCFESGKYASKIAQELNDAIASGGNGTPHNILVSADGSTELIPGSQPIEYVRDAIERAL